MSLEITKVFEEGEKPVYEKGQKIRIFTDLGMVEVYEIFEVNEDKLVFGLKDYKGDVFVQKEMSKSELSKFTCGESAKLVDRLNRVFKVFENFDVVLEKKYLGEFNEICEEFYDGVADYFYRNDKQKLVSALERLSAMSRLMFTLIVGVSPADIIEETGDKIRGKVPEVVFEHGERIDNYVHTQELIAECLETIRKIEAEKQIN